MRLDWDETIHGLTMLEVRDLVKQFTRAIHVDSVQQLLGADVAAPAMIEELIA